jgi:hypothetical protein
VFLEYIDYLDGFLLGLEDADDIHIGDQEGRNRVHHYRNEALESRESHGNAQGNADDLFEDEEDINDVLSCKFTLVPQCFFEQVCLIIIGHEYLIL